MQGWDHIRDGPVAVLLSTAAAVGIKQCIPFMSSYHHQLHSTFFQLSVIRLRHTGFYRQQLSDSQSTIRTAMCLRSSIDRFAFPCIYEVEGITTMPVCRSLKSGPIYVRKTDSHRYLVVVVPPVWNVETPSGSFPASAAHSVARLSIRLRILVPYVLAVRPYLTLADLPTSVRTQALSLHSVLVASRSIGEYWK